MAELATLKSPRLNRRDAIVAATAGTWGLARATSLFALDKQQEPATLAFFVVGDTHYLANKAAPSQMDEASAQICGRLVDRLNELPGQSIPMEAGGGEVLVPRGLIHTGDIIDTGDKQGGVTAQMQQTEWNAFEKDYGLTGTDGRLKFPVYEVFGNHDAPHGKGLALEKIKERNRSRPTVGNVSSSGLHFSWDWQDVHFINLGLIVGTDKSFDRKRRYNALDSLEFLIADLKDRVGDSGRPVIITHHVDVARYTGTCDLAVSADSKEWDPCDVHAFHRRLENYKIAAIFYGHTHVRNVLKWDGVSAKAETGITLFNADNGSHFAGDAQAFFYVEVTPKRLTVREYQTKDRWQTGFFTPQTWTVPIG